ncbi:MAG: uncharacterized protein A8A55_1766 [Amphiamblys sp. WSBS2006]|nr:MAG: uncharacterized protein A8A55_1766 [Amphiamblys sp. WSBS2006]
MESLKSTLEDKRKKLVEEHEKKDSDKGQAIKLLTGEPDETAVGAEHTEKTTWRASRNSLKKTHSVGVAVEPNTNGNSLVSVQEDYTVYASHRHLMFVCNATGKTVSKDVESRVCDVSFSPEDKTLLAVCAESIFLVLKLKTEDGVPVISTVMKKTCYDELKRVHWRPAHKNQFLLCSKNKMELLEIGKTEMSFAIPTAREPLCAFSPSGSELVCVIGDEMLVGHALGTKISEDCLEKRKNMFPETLFVFYTARSCVAVCAGTPPALVFFEEKPAGGHTRMELPHEVQCSSASRFFYDGKRDTLFAVASQRVSAVTGLGKLVSGKGTLPTVLFAETDAAPLDIAQAPDGSPQSLCVLFEEALDTVQLVDGDQKDPAPKKQLRGISILPASLFTDTAEKEQKEKTKRKEKIKTCEEVEEKLKERKQPREEPKDEKQPEQAPDQIEKTIERLFETKLIPAIERSTQEMMRQMLVEYEKELRGRRKEIEQLQEKTVKETKALFSIEMAAVRKAVEQIVSEISVLRTSTDNLQRAVSKTPHQKNIIAEVKEAIQEGRVNDALSCVVFHGDEKSLLWVCCNVDPVAVFENTEISREVVFGLAECLSVLAMKKNEAVVEWVRELVSVVGGVETPEERSVIKSLHDSLQEFLDSTQKNTPLRKDLRTLALFTRSFLNFPKDILATK